MAEIIIPQKRTIIRGTLCYLFYGSQAIMILRNSDKNDIHYQKVVAPGGMREGKETYQECARRETMEETGVEINCLEQRGRAFFNNRDRTFNGKMKSWDYACNIFYGQARNLPTRTKTDKGDDIIVVPKFLIPTQPQHEADKPVYFFTEHLPGKNIEVRCLGESLESIRVLSDVEWDKLTA